MNVSSIHAYFKLIVRARRIQPLTRPSRVAARPTIASAAAREGAERCHSTDGKYIGVDIFFLVYPFFSFSL